MTLIMEGICKRYGELLANDEVSLEVGVGELHALLGENGAGKSTLMKILGGLIQPDAGRILLDGNRVSPRSPREAAALGIGLVHQHFMLVDTLNGADNLRLAHPGLTRTEVEELARRHGLAVNLDRPVGSLSVGERQRVEILKALGRGVRWLILDEPTAVLTPQESERLLEVLRGLAAAGCSVIFISHKLPEVLQLCQRVTVLRQGRSVASQSLEGVNASQLASWMVGQELELDSRRRSAQLGPVRLEVRELTSPGLASTSFSLRQGEILGLAGVSGNGQSELAAALTGLAPAVGSICLDGEEIGSLSVRGRLERGLAFIPEERNGVGAVLSMSVLENAALRDAPRLARRGGWLPAAALRSHAQALVEGCQVRGPSLEARAGSLSGGNLQKLVVGRELARHPKALVAAQPTRGVDVGAQQAIHRRLLQERERGLATLLISEDLEELRRLCDRIAIMYSGRIAVILDGEASLEEIGLGMAGGAP